MDENVIEWVTGEAGIVLTLSQKKYINRILFNGEWKNAPLKDLETARRALSPLIRYIAEEEERAVYLDLTDRILAEAYLPDPCTAFPES